ncbi:Uncharacterised protein [Streptococcus pneumoniae]|nr:Uncharacterised protein [Streptococcus pneumoniae]
MMSLQTIQQIFVENMLLRMLVSVILKKKMVVHLQQEILELNVRQGYILLL